VAGLVEPSSRRAVELSRVVGVFVGAPFMRVVRASCGCVCGRALYACCARVMRLWRGRGGGDVWFAWVVCIASQVFPALAQPAPAATTQPAPAATAQSAPDVSAEDLKQQARLRALRERQEPRGDVRLERALPGGTARLPMGERPCFEIKRLVLDGARWRRFRWALKAADAKGDRARGRCLGSAGIRVVLERVQNAIIARGYVTTRVVVPTQDLSTGVLRLTVQPGVIGAIRWRDAGAGGRWQSAFPSGPGDVLNLQQIEQALENLQHAPGVRVTMQLVPSEAPHAPAGSSDIVIDWQQDTRWHPQVWLDDSGSTASGRWQAGALVSFGNLLGVNEQVSLNVGGSVLNGSGRGTRHWGVQTGLPLGQWFWAAHVGDYQHHQGVAGAFEDYVYSGRGRQGELHVSRLLWRSARSKTSARLGVWQRSSDNAVNDVDIAVQRRRTGGWEAGLSQRRYWGRSTLDFGVKYRRGTGAFGALRAPEEAFGEGTSRSRRVLLDARVVMPFEVAGRLLRYQVSGHWQWNRSGLVAHDHVAIGGRDSVRGVDGDAFLSGERGGWVRNALGLGMAAHNEVYLGADIGRVGGARPAGQSGRRLAGLVAGMRGCRAGVHWDLFVGRPVWQPRHLSGTATFGVSLSSGLKRC